MNHCSLTHSQCRPLAADLPVRVLPVGHDSRDDDTIVYLRSLLEDLFSELFYTWFIWWLCLFVCPSDYLDLAIPYFSIVIIISFRLMFLFFTVFRLMR
jgi:hypothetical protein